LSCLDARYGEGVGASSAGRVLGATKAPWRVLRKEDAGTRRWCRDRRQSALLNQRNPRRFMSAFLNQRNFWWFQRAFLNQRDFRWLRRSRSDRLDTMAAV
jgi:hypothetical protein